MSYEWLLIGSPLLFLLGWAAARLDIAHIRKTAGELPGVYLSGLSELLKKNEGKALDAFLQAPFIGGAPEEFQFAVGELSRRRGEHRRALQVHRQLVARENLPPEIRRRALWNLALDYNNMGFVDLAEQHALPLLDEADFGEKAFALILNIRQRRRRFDTALELVESLGEEALLLRRAMVGQWHCQFAAAAEGAAAKRELLQKALAYNPDCVRASLMLAEIAAAAGETAAAAEHLAAVEKQNPAYLFLAAAPLAAAAGDLALPPPQTAGGVTVTGPAADAPLPPPTAAETPAFPPPTGGGKITATGKSETQILFWLEEFPAPQLLRAAREVLPPDAAAAATEKYLLQNGGVFAAAFWAEDRGRQSAPLKKHGEILQKAAGKNFACKNCGYEVNNFSWQCRGCLEWETLVQRNP